nr:MAG TPA: hypothetical protein [Caudoviricetes sp.]
MGRKIASFWRHFFVSKISTIFRVDFWAHFLGLKMRLISIFFSYKEISVPKIALKPLVPVRLRAVSRKIAENACF